MVCAWNPGQYDELETFNYPLTAQQVAAGYPTFAGSTNDIMADTNYVGRSDMLQQYVDGNPANVVPCRLGYWRFDSPLLYAEQGQIPLFVNDISLVPSWSGTALNINSHSASQITYPDVGSNGWANVNCRQGSLRFWFKPNGSGGTGHSSPFVYMGTANASDEWGLWLNGGHTSISFITGSNGAAATNLTTNCSLSTTNWTQIVLTYGSGGSSLYTNGSPVVTNGSPVTYWPSLANRELGMVIGNSTAYNVSINGQFDEMETFNYQLAATDIASNFQIVASVDSDLNGIPDLLEDIHLTTARPFLGAPVVITGTIEAEQFDMGGPGIGYHNAGSHPPSAYRPTGMFITNCNDLGGGYCLDQTQSNDWAQYTINVLAPQTYMVEVRTEAIGTNTGGVFQCDFTNGVGVLTNSAGISNSTGPLIITTTNWTNVSKVVYLTTGTKVMTLHCLANAPYSTNVGRFNYISIYPYWTHSGPGPTTTYISSSSLSGGTNWGDGVTNAAIIQSEIANLPAAGGTVTLPAGIWYLAQTTPNDSNDAWQNAALYITNNNVAIAGSNTTLVAFDRSTTLLSLGEDPLGHQTQCTNFTLRDFTLVAQPHLVSTNSGPPYTNIYELGQLWPTNSYATGALTAFYGDNAVFPIQFAFDILISNCVFLHGDRSIQFQGYNSNCLVTACTFLPWDATNFFTGATNQSPTNTAYTAPNGGSRVGIFANGNPNYNLSIIGNAYIGNSAATNTNYSANIGPDGFVWCQTEGNVFIARNSISNYALEGIQLNAGPNAVVGNTYNTVLSYGSGLDVFGADNGLTGTSQDYSTCFIGNSVCGGFAGQEASGADTPLPYSFNCSGNTFTLYDADGYPSLAVQSSNCLSAGICGNMLVSGGMGFRYDGSCSNALMLNNDFGRATYRGIGYMQAGDALIGYLPAGETVNTAQVFSNILGQGVSFHVQLPYANSFGWFLDGNTYLNAYSNSVPLFLDPLSSAVHIFN
jgi:hypothetical protein